MRKIIASAWMSLDGVFDADSMAHWYFPFDSKEGQDFIRKEIMDCDAIILGRTTYEMLASFCPNKSTMIWALPVN